MNIILENPCGIAQAEALACQLESAFQDSMPVTIDCSAVMRIDTSVLQLIYSFCFAMKEAGVNVSWRDPSEEFCRASELLGLKELLAL